MGSSPEIQKAVSKGGRTRVKSDQASLGELESDGVNLTVCHCRIQFFKYDHHKAVNG